jgi:hypothetical protein
METVMVMIIVGLAVAYLVKKYTGSVKKSDRENGCSCGCNSCPSSGSCNTEN